MDSRIKELAEKAERLAKEHVACRRENARLKRLLLAAESKIRELSLHGAPSDGPGITEITRQMEKMKQERKSIREKVEKMSVRLEKFFQE